jgi:[ribosomal protein S5]-alanine N-acetyltransferase
MIAQYFFQPFPVLDLGDIILREITDEDGEAYFNYMSMPEMSPFLTEATKPKNVEAALEEVRYWGSLFRNKRSFYWGIAQKDNNTLIGTAGFNNISIAHLRGEISYDLDYKFWGKGIMLKSIKGILKFADFALQLVRVQATVIMDNERSVKVLERCGFSNEGILKKYEIVEGTHRDYYMYARVH